MIIYGPSKEQLKKNIKQTKGSKAILNCLKKYFRFNSKTLEFEKAVK